MSKELTVSRRRYRPAIRALNVAARAAELCGLPLGKLDQDSILRAAKRSVKLTDWGSEGFLEPMERMLSCARESEITALARLFSRQASIKSVANRLLVEEYIRRHPGVEQIPIERPVFILGFPRTGTTLLQNLLSLHEERRALEFWELTSPVPVSADLIEDKRRRLKAAAQILKMAYFVAPEMGAVHEIRVDSVEECWPLFSPTFAVLNYDLQSGFDAFGRWLLTHDMTGPYAEYRRELQLLAHHRETGNFVLKCPEHLWFLDALFSVFPDALVVWTHRDPLASVASYCSLMSLNRRMLYGSFDPLEIGERISERFHTGVSRAMAVREELNREDQFFDVDFATLVTDPLTMVRSITQRFDLPFSQQDEQSVQNWLGTRRADSRGSHVYRADIYGLEPEPTRDRFRNYIERFNITIKDD